MNIQILVQILSIWFSRHWAETKVWHQSRHIQYLIKQKSERTKFWHQSRAITLLQMCEKWRVTILDFVNINMINTCTQVGKNLLICSQYIGRKRVLKEFILFIFLFILDFKMVIHLVWKSFYHVALWAQNIWKKSKLYTRIANTNSAHCLSNRYCLKYETINLYVLLPVQYTGTG